MNTEILTRTIPEPLAGARLDKALAETFPEYSRARLQQWLQAGLLQVDSGLSRQKDKVLGGEVVTLQPEPEPDERVLPEAMPLNVVYEDDALLVINKPAGLVVHPGAGNRSGTLQNGLLHYAPELAGVPRAGIVHRLDKDTTGLMVVARTLKAQTALVRALKAREISREYTALVKGHVTAGGFVEAALGRNPKDRLRMAVLPETATGARAALTHYRVASKFPGYTHLNLKLDTGRTHQIRVHMAHIQHPIVGDPLYGGRSMPVKGFSAEVQQVLVGFSRQALHAWRLAFAHPEHGEMMAWEAPIPDDMQRLLDLLQATLHDVD